MKNRLIIFVTLLLLSACSSGAPQVFEGDNEAEHYVNEPVSVPENEQDTISVTPVQSQDLPQWQLKFEEFLEGKMESDHIPGMAVTLVDSDGLLFARGFGFRDVKHNLPVTADTLFHIGSTQKSMTAMLIATLIDDGYFTWDTPVIKMFPEFQLEDQQAAQQVTLRHLLSMRAGISEEAEDDLDDEGSLSDVLDAVYNSRLIGYPGEVFEYSNLSVTLAGYLAAATAGDTTTDIHTAYTMLLEERILDPIGMTNATVYFSEAQNSENFSYSYSVSRGGEPILTESYDVEKDILAPSGSLKVSAAEMGLYIQTQLNRGVAQNGERIVSEENLSETWIPYLEHYAMGWEENIFGGLKIICHEGAYDDFISVIGFIPEKNIGFVVLVNSEEAGENVVGEVPSVLAGLLAD